MVTSIEIDFAPMVASGKDIHDPASKGGVVVTVRDPYTNRRKFFVDDPAGAALLRTTILAAWQAIGRDWEQYFSVPAPKEPQSFPFQPTEAALAGRAHRS